MQLIFHEAEVRMMRVGKKGPHRPYGSININRGHIFCSSNFFWRLSKRGEQRPSDLWISDVNSRSADFSANRKSSAVKKIPGVIYSWRLSGFFVFG